MVEMAVRQRILNSTAPFSGPPQTELKGSYTNCPTPDKGTEEGSWKEGKRDFMARYNPILNKLLTQGTAEQVGEGPLKTSTFIAQAECETLDSQEFSPSCSASFVPSPNCFTSSLSSEPNNVACPLNACSQEPDSSLAQQAPRKKARKRQKRKEKKKEEKRGKQRQRHRVPSGVPEQESGSQPATSQDDVSKGHSGRGVSSTYCSSNVESSEVHDTGPPPYPQQVYSRNPGCTALGLGILPRGPLPGLRSFEEQSSSDSSLSSVGDCTLALAGLRGSVSQGDSCFAGPFVRDVERDMWEEEEEDEELSECVSVPNEGIIFFNKNIQPVKYEYREGKQYHTQFLKQGSFGEVYSAQDANTGFRFAAKKIPLKSFSSEEVGTWSALSSPRIVKLFGVVREGPHIILLMDLKYGSLGQLITERGRLPEDLSLHYHCQILGALEHLVKKRVAHLDIKADNVLLSEDGRDTFLCDFGHAERLDSCGQSLSGSQDMKGTETHMAPEIVKGHPRGAKADVWSSCCMLLHMLNGRQPWTRYYTCRLYLKIANEPPPLREVPSDCSPLTVEVATAGLQKDPAKRASASAMREKAARALKTVGGLTSSVRGPYAEPLSVVNNPSCSSSAGSSPSEEGEDLVIWGKTASAGLTKSEPNDYEYVEEADAERKPEPDLPLSLQTLMCNEKNHKTGGGTTVSELELRKLERDFYLSSLSQLHSAEMQEQLLSCLSSDCHSNWDTWDKKDSGRWSISPGEDLSSGVFSYNSQPDGQVFSNDWLGHTQLPPPRCFEGVDICIKDFNRRSIQIREMRRVKVGHIATGISDQISQRVFTLETQEGQQVAHDEEVQDSGLQLCCVPAPDYSPAWRWRIRDGVLETRDRVNSSHTSSALGCSFNEP